MDPRKKSLLFALLFLVGVFAVVGWAWFGPVSRARWNDRLNATVVAPWMDVLNPNTAYEHQDRPYRPRQIVTQTEVASAWAATCDELGNDSARMGRLRRKIHAYLDFLETEYADAADIYETGRHGLLSEASKANRSRVLEELGEVGRDLLDTFDVEVRETAYRDSPVTARGDDPAIRNHSQFNAYVQEWLVEARAVVDEFVVPRGR